MKIGFFDSGLGGLVILKAVAEALPQYDYEFFGDTLNLPFGDKSEEEIYKLTKAGMQILFNRGCLINIIACNTSSAESLRKLQDTFLIENYPDRKILGVIIPAVEELIASSTKDMILLATKRTIESGKYERELENLSAGHVKVHGVAMSHLVPLIESGEIAKAVDAAAKAIFETSDRVGEIDSVVLGCTHYTLLKDGLIELFPNLKFISQDQFIPKKLQNYLNNHSEMASRLTRESTLHVSLTRQRADYEKIITKLLGEAFVSNL